MTTHAEDRRRKLVEVLRTASEPVRGSDLAAKMGVSRQVIVGDMAILRAEGQPILGSPQGYLLFDRGPVAGVPAVLAVRHDRAGARRELETLVEHGITVVDVMVDHPIYGEIRGNLMLATQGDVDRFLQSLDRGEAELLSRLTGGVHLHTVRAPSAEALEEARGALRDAGILL